MKNQNEICVAAASMSVPLSTMPGSEPDVVVIQYMPPGPQKISPFVNGEPMEMSINVTKEYADVFEAANQALIAQANAGTGDLPFTDFNHDDQAASSRTRRYYWNETRGVLLETKLTASGKSAIQGGDYSRFSPQWIFNKNTFEPLGLPVNQGGFVNRAAFKNIGKLPVASASHAEHRWAPGASRNSLLDAIASALAPVTADLNRRINALSASASGAELTPADRASTDALDDSCEAWKLGKAAYSTGGGHQKAAAAHRKAAASHEKAASLYRGEEKFPRAQEEIAQANLHRETAERHEKYDGQSGVEHELITRANSIASAKGCDLETAKRIVCRQDFALYLDFIKSESATAKAGQAEMATGKVQEFSDAVNELTAAGKSFHEAVQFVGYRRPDLALAYRASMKLPPLRTKGHRLI